MRTLAGILAAAALLLSGCAIRQTDLVPEDNRVSTRGVLALWGDLIVVRGERFDVHLHFQNLSKAPILVYARDITGGKGESMGKVGFPVFGIGERTIDLKPGEIKAVTLTCKHAPAKGDYRILVEKVYENPANDGRTAGDVAASGLEWTVAESAVK